MKRIHYLLLGLLVSLTIAAVSPGLPPTRIAPGSGITVVTNGVNNFTLTASGGIATLDGSGTNTKFYSSGTTNSATTIIGGVATNSNPVINASQTWNTAAVTFTALKLDITNTASAAASKLLDFHVGGSSVLSILNNTTESHQIELRNEEYRLKGAFAGSLALRPAGNTTPQLVSCHLGLIIGTTGNNTDAVSVEWGTDGGSPSFFRFGPDGQNVMAVRNGLIAQTNRLYHTYTDASNHQRLALYTTTNSVNIAAETAGTGAANLDVNLITAGTGKVVLNDNGLVMGKTITAPATTGDQTINKAAGRVNIAAAGTTVVVTCSLATANSIIIAVAATADATAMVTSVVPAAGSFTINTVATTAETAFNFIIIN